MSSRMFLKLTVLSWSVAVVLGHRTNNCSTKAYTGFTPCGDKKCCCKHGRAICKEFGPDLTYIPPLPHNIDTLSFDGNYLQVLNRKSFSNITVRNIHNMSLNANDIWNISANAFTEFVSLQHLNLSGNKLTTFYANPFKGLQKLRIINLANNKIRDIANDVVQESFEEMYLTDNALVGEFLQTWFCSADGEPVFPNLTFLQLVGNFINKLTTNSFKCLGNLRFLGFNGNVVQSIENNAFANLHTLSKVEFGYMHRSISKISELSFNNSHMEVLNFRENYITIKPVLSKVIFKHSTNVRVLDISGNVLKKISPEQFLEMLAPLKKLEILNACHCQIITLPPNFLSYFRNLTRLNLDGNNIHTLEYFKNVYDLKVLSLQGNSFSGINELDVPNDFMNSLEKLSLADNPFDCTCALLWFRSMTDDVAGTFGNITLISWPDRYKCLTPLKLTHTKLTEYRPTKSSCANVLEIIIICLAMFFVALVMISIVSFRYRWYIKYWFYKLKTFRTDPESSPLLCNENQGYDGYVIYHTEDRQFVHHDLRLFMERKHDLKLHIWERNAPGNGSKLEGMVDGIYASKNAIAVISKNSIQDSWVKFQMDVALDRQVELKKDFLMLVILEDVNLKTLSKYWCVMLTRLNAARWCHDDTDVKHTVFEQQINNHFRRS